MPPCAPRRYQPARWAWCSAYFQDRTLWPEYQALSLELDAHLEELTTRVIREAIDEDVSEAAESTAPKALPGSSVE
jgi:hypothetical protein